MRQNLAYAVFHEFTSQPFIHGDAHEVLDEERMQNDLTRTIPKRLVQMLRDIKLLLWLIILQLVLIMHLMMHHIVPLFLLLEHKMRRIVFLLMRHKVKKVVNAMQSKYEDSMKIGTWFLV